MSNKNRDAPAGGRRLILLRHAKSDWPDGVDDKKRPLADRGRKAASLMGDYLEREGLVPDLVLVSTAERTQQTWGRVKKAFSQAPEVRDADAIYEAPAETLMSVLKGVEPVFRVVMMIGHNPGMEDLAVKLIGGGDPDARRRISEKYPTGGLAVIDFTADTWQAIGSASGVLERFVTPRSLV
ncbi:SixA phosphatase family protein [Rhizobium daejeonense]